MSNKNKTLSNHHSNHKKSSDKYDKNNSKKKNAGHYNKNKRTINNNNTNNNNNDNNNDNNNNNYNNCKSTKTKTVTTSYKIYNVEIGERKFCLTEESLKRDEPNFFTAAFFGYFSESNNTHIFIERDPIYFNMIVRYLRGYEVDWPNDRISMSNLLADVKFYGFERLQHLLEEIYEENYPEDPIPWKILTYAPEDNPVVAINIKDVERERWDGRSLIYNINQISKKISSVNDGDTVAQENDENNENVENNENNENDENNVNDNNDNVTTEDDNATNTDDVIIEPNPEKGLYRLEIHGKNAVTTVISNHNNGIKFENFTLKNSEEEETFRMLTESFRTPEGSLTLSPSLKLPFLKDSCIEIDGSKYYTHKDLSGYFGVTDKTKLYFEEIVIRIVDAPFLMRARARTIPHYYASQPTVQPAQH